MHIRRQLPFLTYWRRNGGLAINGYPLSDEFVETLEDGRTYVVQYFERALRAPPRASAAVWRVAGAVRATHS